MAFFALPFNSYITFHLLLGVIICLLGVIRQLGMVKFNKDYLLTWEQEKNTVKATVELARALRDLYKKGVSLKTFEVGVKSAIEDSTDDNTIVANRYSS